MLTFMVSRARGVDKELVASFAKAVGCAVLIQALCNTRRTRFSLHGCFRTEYSQMLKSLTSS